MSNTIKDEDKADHALGEQLAAVLQLKPRPDGFFLLGEGYHTKTHVGLARVVRSIMADNLTKAAPDLLAALRLFVAQYEGNGHDEREQRPEMKAARKAINKAEGRGGE
jgi:hypothetical protein